MDLSDVLFTGGVDQRPDRDGDVARADLVLRQGVAAFAVDDFGHIVIFVDDLHRHETTARVRQRDRDRPRIEVEEGRGIERIAVESDHGLIVDPRRFAAMKKFPDGAAVLQDPAKIQIGFGACEIVDRDRHGIGRRRLCLGAVALRRASTPRRRRIRLVFIAVLLSCSAHPLQRRRLPFAGERGGLRPIQPQDREERPLRRRQPVRPPCPRPATRSGCTA